MKKLILILTFASLTVQAAVLGDSDIVGKYYDQSGAEVVRVFRYAGKLKVNFKDACTAELLLRYNTWTAVCTVGSGYRQVAYTVKNVELKGSSVVLSGKVLEYGDEDLGFDGSFTAIKR